jgi:hypothetical protein
MMQRLRNALLRPSAAKPPDRTYRPNELRLDVVRAERLRRESRRAVQAVRQPERSLEELQERKPLESAAAAPALRSRQLPRQIASLKTRSGLRQAWLIKEILGPPPALRNPYDDRAR